LLKEKKKVYQSRTLNSIHMNTYKQICTVARELF